MSKHESEVHENRSWSQTSSFKVACFFKTVLGGSPGPVSLPNIFLKVMLERNISVGKNCYQNQDKELKYFSI